MKKILVIAAFPLIGGSYAASAQTVIPTDSLNNTETINLTSPDKYLAGYNGNFTMQGVFTKVSGTVSGTVTLQSTVDGTNWNNLDCPCSFGGNTTVTDSITLANVSGAQSVQWHCTGIAARQVRMQGNTSGTMVIQAKGSLIKQE